MEHHPQPEIVAAQQAPATVLFDGDCGFCRSWVSRWQAHPPAGVRFLPYQEVAPGQFGIAASELSRRLHFISPGGAVSGGAEAVFRVLALDPQQARWLRWFERDPTFAELCEAGYELVASQRSLFSRLSAWVGWTEAATCTVGR